MLILTRQHILALTQHIYRPPRYNPIFLTEFFEFLSIALITYDKTVLLGDLNFHIYDVVITYPINLRHSPT